MNVTKAAPYYDVLMIGKQLVVTIASGGHALVEGFVGDKKLISQTVVATTTFGAYLSNVNFKVSNLTGLVDVVESQVLIAYNPAAINETGGNMSGVAITAGSINNAPIGATTPNTVKTSNLQMVFTDSTATPGNVTNNSPRGKVSFAAAATTIVITNSLVTATSSVLADMNVIDGALTGIVSCLAGAGTITITGNAAATTAGVARCDFIVIN